MVSSFLDEVRPTRRSRAPSLKRIIPELQKPHFLLANEDTSSRHRGDLESLLRILNKPGLANTFLNSTAIEPSTPEPLSGPPQSYPYVNHPQILSRTVEKTPSPL